MNKHHKSQPHPPKHPAAVVASPTFIPVPHPLPEPSPFAGGDDYETQFNTRYYQTRDERMAPLFYGRPGAQAGTELTQEQKWVLCDVLNKENVPFDEEIDAQSEAPYKTMYQRAVIYGYEREPRGIGRQVGEPKPVNKADFFGPVVDGYLLVTVDINELKKG